MSIQKEARQYAKISFRRFMMICAVAFLLFGILNYDPQNYFYAPLWPSLAISGLFVALYALSYYRPMFETIFQPLLHSFFVLVFCWILFFTYANDFRAIFVIQLLVGTLTINLGLFVPRHMVVFALFTTLSSATAIFFSDAPEVPRGMFITMMIFGQAIVYISTSHKYRAHRELVEAKEEAEEASRAKDLFIAKTSHELRTPLNGILGFTQLLMADEKDPERRRMHQIVAKSTEILFKLINDLLDFSKLSAGDIRIERQPFALRDMVETVSAGAEHAAKERGLEFSVVIAATVPPLVIGDRLRLSQILMNLLGNAVKFTDHGRVALAVDWLPAAARPTLQIVVSDTGPGIPAAQIPRIFERFVQVTDDPEKHRQGLGLGLSIVKSIVDLMGGAITVDSVVGAGSTFTVRIPVDLPQDAAAAPFDKASCILLAEDDEVNRYYFKKVLDRMGVRCEEARTGKELVERFEQVDCQLILTDLQMPEFDGYEAIRRICLTPKFRAKPVPLIAISAFSVEHEKEKLATACVTDFIMKPVRAEELMTVIRRHLPL